MGIGGATRLIDDELMGRCQYGDRLAIQERAMHTTTQKLMLQGGLILLGALVVSSIGGWAPRPTAHTHPAPPTAAPRNRELRSPHQAPATSPGELAGPPPPLDRANASIRYSTHHA